MKLSTKIRYGARAMLELACNYGKGPVDLHEIATREGISMKYLEQVMIPLRTKGLVKSIRGSKGGYALAKHPSQISLKDLFEVLDGPLNLVHCLKDPKGCERSATCVTRDIWSEVSGSIDRVLDSITLDEMVMRKREKEGMMPPMFEI